MRNTITAILLSVPLLALGSGCIGGGNYPEEKQAWSESDWKQAVREDQERYKSEDEQSAGITKPIVKGSDALWDQVMRFYYFLSGDSPFNAAKNLIDPTFPDRRRQAIMWLSRREWGRHDPYLKYFITMAKTDSDHAVRAIAIRTLNRARVRDQVELYLKALDDRHAMVRLEAAKALANMPNPEAVRPLTRHLQASEENMDVRIACADALRCYRTAESAQSLVRVLRERDFGICWQARKSLKLMTGQDYRYDQAAWLEYLSGSQKPFG